jgi:hypothetical protein
MLACSESLGPFLLNVARTVLCVLVLVLGTLPAAAQEAAEGCCEVPGACISPSTQAFCLRQSGGRFFAGHECGGVDRAECVLVHPVTSTARFELSLDCGDPVPLSGSVAVAGETKIARRDGAGGDPSIEVEIVSMELSGTPPSFGPLRLDSTGPQPTTGESDLESGVFDALLQPLRLEIDHPGCPPDVTSAGTLPLLGSGIFSFPPLGGELETVGGAAAPLLAGGEQVGTLSGFSLAFGASDREAGCCQATAQPSATLLVPYFEVDLDDPAGPTTLLDVTNASDSFVVARVVLWTDLGVPTLTSWLYLSPADVQSLNLRDLLAGRLPDTAAVLADPRRPILDFEPCTAGGLAPALSAADVAFLRAAHSGQPLPAAADAAAAPAVVASLCAGIDRGDRVARGYVTVDAVNRCAYPPTVASFAHREALLDAFELSRLNALWGDYLYVDGNENYAQSEAMIHRPHRPLAVDPGDYTFYGRYLAFSAADGRLPLPDHYQARFLQGGPFDGGTRLIVWRDNLSAAVDPVPCGTPAAWQPLGEARVVAWDEEENAVAVDDLASVCPGAAGVSFACDLQGLPFPFGVLDLDLAHGDGEAAQAAVVTVLRARGRFSVGQRAVPVDDRCGPKAASLQAFGQALNACEYEVLGTTDGCPHAAGDHVFVSCVDGRCPLYGPQGQAAAALCPGRKCGLGLRLVTHCQVRETGPRYKRVEKCN